MANANQVIVNGETILDLRSDTVTPETLQKGYTAHDKSGTKITGTLEASSSGGAKETWVLNEKLGSKNATYTIDFTSNGTKYSKIVISIFAKSRLKYGDTLVNGSEGGAAGWINQAYRKIIFDTPPTGALLTWLQANGVKQPDDTAIQDSKALTITSNGTISVTPDAPYDALKKIDVTVDVASGGGGGETTQLQVNVSGSDIEALLFCLWQTSDGWMGTANFDSATAFTIPNVIVGGYVIFTHDPSAAWYFLAENRVGVEDISVGAMDAQFDLQDAALVVKVTAPSPSFIIRLLN